MTDAMLADAGANGVGINDEKQKAMEASEGVRASRRVTELADLHLSDEDDVAKAAKSPPGERRDSLTGLTPTQALAQSVAARQQVMALACFDGGGGGLGFGGGGPSLRSAPAHVPSHAHNNLVQSESVDDRLKEVAITNPGGGGGGGSAGAAAKRASMARRAFELIDKDGGGTLSRAEVILAVRRDTTVRTVLGLPAVIHQEDGSRDRFEQVFQAMAGQAKHINADEFERFVSGLAPPVAAAASTASVVGIGGPNVVQALEAEGWTVLARPSSEASVPRSRRSSVMRAAAAATAAATAADAIAWAAAAPSRLSSSSRAPAVVQLRVRQSDVTGLLRLRISPEHSEEVAAPSPPPQQTASSGSGVVRDHAAPA